MTDWSGDEYARLSGLQRSMIGEAMSGLTFRPNDAVLDIGCGDGFLTRAIATLTPGGVVIGADPSHRMVATAAESATTGAAGPWFVVADVRGLPFAERFDAAVSFNALHWVPEQEQALRQIATVLRPGGSVTVQVVCAGPRPSLEAVAMQLCRTPHWAPCFEGFEAPFLHVDPERYGDVAAAAGLTLDDVTVADREWDFGSREAFLAWSAMGSTAWTDRLPQDRRAQFVEEQVDAYEPIAGAPGLLRFMQMRARLHREESE
ncbi:class I SAM-dependent methyltransferase [Mycolicibacterium sp.]|uniref:class I SAM-dependent methyltransferase n=1 Tax=Mycolicibacterium sp. TaxID=2320850 RepID=UPI001A2F7037|nr:class I SAM-dependent methyltransferase [Mycolicibacterium sp.]MBJ7339185.1 methyltransferase domain-containing protein [Mycolicibacterium sp.]